MSKPPKSALVARLDSDNSVCPRCGAFFACGMLEGHDHCWCADLPLSMPLEASAESCYCPACLKELIAEHSAE